MLFQKNEKFTPWRKFKIFKKLNISSQPHTSDFNKSVSNKSLTLFVKIWIEMISIYLLLQEEYIPAASGWRFFPNQSKTTWSFDERKCRQFVADVSSLLHGLSWRWSHSRKKNVQKWSVRFQQGWEYSGTLIIFIACMIRFQIYAIVP